MLPDVSGLYPRLTPREHIEYYGQLQGLSGAGRSTSASRQLFQTLDMDKIADRRTQGFSHGERTKVALARALVHDPQQRAARRADQRPRRDEHARGARHHPPPARRRPLRGVLEPRHAGSVGAVRCDHRDRARPHRRVGHARRAAGADRAQEPRRRVRRAGRPRARRGANDAVPRADRRRVPQGSEGRVSRSAIAATRSWSARSSVR